MKRRSRDSKNPFPHDHFVRKILSEKRYCLDVFKLILSKEQMAVFDWSTLKTELSSIIDEKGREKRMDLLVSVLRKDTRRPSKILFLMEHKSQHDPKVLLQFLCYLVELYLTSLDPIMVVLINQSPNKVWKGPINFHDYLRNFDGKFRELFKDYVLFFKCFVLNIGDLKIPGDTKGLTIEPLVYILQNIYGIDEPKLVEAFRKCRKLSLSERKKVMVWIGNYVKQYDSDFTWKDIIGSEQKAYPKKEDRFMMTFIEEARAELRKEARAEFEQKGLQQGIQKGRMEQVQEVILNMLKKQLDISLISEVTGMPEKEIKKLKKGD